MEGEGEDRIDHWQLTAAQKVYTTNTHEQLEDVSMKCEKCVRVLGGGGVREGGGAGCGRGFDNSETCMTTALLV